MQQEQQQNNSRPNTTKTKIKNEINESVNKISIKKCNKCGIENNINNKICKSCNNNIENLSHKLNTQNKKNNVLVCFLII